jgi:hypothetical protein
MGVEEQSVTSYAFPQTQQRSLLIDQMLSLAINPHPSMLHHPMIPPPQGAFPLQWVSVFTLIHSFSPLKNGSGCPISVVEKSEIHKGTAFLVSLGKMYHENQD